MLAPWWAWRTSGQGSRGRLGRGLCRDPSLRWSSSPSSSQDVYARLLGEGLVQSACPFAGTSPSGAAPSLAAVWPRGLLRVKPFLGEALPWLPVSVAVLPSAPEPQPHPAPPAAPALLPPTPRLPEAPLALLLSRQAAAAAPSLGPPSTIISCHTALGPSAWPSHWPSGGGDG